MSLQETPIGQKQFRHVPEQSDIQQYTDFIIDWESYAGEEFLDYFMDDAVFVNSWAFWLLGKGFNQRANFLIESILNDHIDNLDTDSKYHINLTDLYLFPDENEIHAINTVEYRDDEKLHNELFEMDVKLWVEFLLSTKVYKNIFLDWISSNQPEDK